MNDLASAHLPPILFRGPDECERTRLKEARRHPTTDATGLVFER
jgi:hypothetical protein